LPGSLEEERGQNFCFVEHNVGGVDPRTHQNFLGSLERRKTGQIFSKSFPDHIYFLNLPGKIMRTFFCREHIRFCQEQNSVRTHV